MNSDRIAMLIVVLLKMVAVICSVCAAWHLACNNLGGWGWFLFVAVALSPTSIKLD